MVMFKVALYMQDGAAEIPADLPLLSMEDLADQVAEVLDHFGYALAALILFASLWYAA